MPAPDNTAVGTGLAGTYYFFERFIEAEGRRYSGVIDGLLVTASSTPSMVLQVAAGEFCHAIASQGHMYAGGTVTLAASNPDEARADLISMYWDGSASHVVATSGILLSNSGPIPPFPPSTNGANYNVTIAIVIVYPGQTEIFDDQIYERRFFLPFRFSGDSEVLATTVVTEPTPNSVVAWDGEGNLIAAGRDVADLGDVIGPLGPVVDSQVALYNGTTGKIIKNATATGRPKLTAGVQSVAAIDLAAEVTGDLPYANLVQASAASRLLLRGSASGAGDWQEGTVGTGLALTGTVLSATGGAGSGPTTVRLTSDATANATTTGTEVTGIRKTSTGTGTFTVRYAIRYQSSASGTGIKFGVNHTGTTPIFLFNMVYQAVGGSAAAATQAAGTPTNPGGSSTRVKSTTAPNMGPTTSVDTANADMLMIIDGLMNVSADGNLELWYCSEAAVSVQVMAESCLILQPIA